MLRILPETQTYRITEIKWILISGINDVLTCGKVVAKGMGYRRASGDFVTPDAVH